MAKKLFRPGQSGNPSGRPKGSTNRFSISDLSKAIETVEKKKKKKFLVHWIETAWGDANAMDNIAHYMLPKLKAIEALIGNFDAELSDAQAEEIRKNMLTRF